MCFVTYEPPVAYPYAPADAWPTIGMPFFLAAYTIQSPALYAVPSTTTACLPVKPNEGSGESTKARYGNGYSTAPGWNAGGRAPGGPAWQFSRARCPGASSGG